jgi:hypothetical protein
MLSGSGNLKFNADLRDFQAELTPSPTIGNYHAATEFNVNI